MPTKTSRRAVLGGIAAAPEPPATAHATATAVNPPRDLDWSAVASRLEQIVDILRRSYVNTGWQLDETAAARAIAYCRRRAAGGRSSGSAEMAIIDFVGNHGQSLDWVFCGDLGGMICIWPAALIGPRCHAGGSAWRELCGSDTGSQSEQNSPLSEDIHTQCRVGVMVWWTARLIAPINRMPMPGAGDPASGT